MGGAWCLKLAEFGHEKGGRSRLLLVQARGIALAKRHQPSIRRRPCVFWLPIEKA